MKFRHTFVLITLLNALFIISVAGCTNTSSTGSTTMAAQSYSPNSGQTETVTAQWQPDGDITAGEYSGSNSYGSYTVHWLIDEQFVYIGIKAKTDGWVSVALQPGSRMKDSDMVIGFVENGKAEILDSYCTDNTGSHPEDTKLGGTNDIISGDGKEESGFTTIEFKRKLSTGDKYDISVNKGKNKIIWGYSTSDSPISKHTSRGYGEIIP